MNSPQPNQWDIKKYSVPPFQWPATNGITCSQLMESVDPSHNFIVFHYRSGTQEYRFGPVLVCCLCLNSSRQHCDWSLVLPLDGMAASCPLVLYRCYTRSSLDLSFIIGQSPCLVGLTVPMAWKPILNNDNMEWRSWDSNDIARLVTKSHDWSQCHYAHW